MPETIPRLTGHWRNATPDSGQYRLELVLTHQGAEAITEAELLFSLAQTLNADEISGARLVRREGDLHRLALPALEPGSEHCITLCSTRGSLQKATDCPYGVHLRLASGQSLDLDVPAGPLNWDLQPPQVRQPECVTTLIPQPTRYNWLDGSAFDTPARIDWQAPDWPHDFPLDTWAGTLVRLAGPALQAAGEPAAWPLRVEPDTDLPAGGYRLDIQAPGGSLRAADNDGLHAGLSALTQWLAGRRVQPVRIDDSPRFHYRGLHLDTARHFIPVDELHDLLDLCALYRLNHLHWHLTDDEAWRLEIRALPQLTERGAWRGPDQTLPAQMGTGASPHGGYYSQAEVRSLVARAGQLGLRIIPEIDLPGHARALLHALPELNDPEDQSDYLSVQSYRDNTLNPGVAGTLDTLKTILAEVVNLFPEVPIHLGSDEVPAGVWQQSPAARALAQAQDLDSTDRLHGWLLGELEHWLRAEHGRAISGWEEIIVDEVVGPETTVYAWQGAEAGLAAARAGYQVVMTPAQHCYLDLAWDPSFHEPGYYWAGTTDLAQVYRFEPLDGWAEESEATRSRLQGVQACLWSELLDSPEKRTYMLLPRLPAIAERAWSAASVQDTDDLRQRCAIHRWHWQRAGWHYRSPVLGW